MVVTSNNPEAFTDVGVLYGTARASAVRGGERFPLSGDFGVYLHHLNATSGARYVGVVVTNPGAVAVTVEAHGAGWSQDDTGGVGLGTSPDYRVSEAWLADARPVSVPPSSLAPLRPLALYTAALAHGHEVDARLAVHASGPVYVYVIASATGSLDEAIQRSRTDAPGNIDVPGTPPPPYGREAGVYSHDTWRATIPLLVPAAGHRVGFQLDTAAGTKGAVQDQAFAALTRYADSAPEAVGMYGDVFDVAFDLAHDGNDASDRRVRLWAVSYAGGAGSRLWDGAASVDGVPAALRLTPAAPRQLLADVRLADGAHRRLTFEAMVPGLASIPAALVLESY